MESTSSHEYYRKLNQQIVQKDNLIRILQMQLKKSKEENNEENDDSQLEELQFKLSELTANIEELETQNNELAKKLGEKNTIPVGNDQMAFINSEESETRVMALEAECENLHDQMSHLKKEIVKYEKELDDKNAYIDILKGEISGYTEKIDDLKAELASGNAGNLPVEKRDTSLSLNDSKEKILERIEMRLDEFDLNGVNVEEIRSLLKVDDSKLEIVLEEKDREIEKLREELKSIDTLKDEKYVLKERINTLTEELEGLNINRNFEVSGSSDNEVLPIVYNVIQALDEFREIFVLDDSDNLKEYKSRVNRVHSIFKKLARELKIETIMTIGEKYDSRVHEVSEYIRSKEHDDDLVIDEVRKGYRQGSRVLRPALVKIVKNKQKCKNCSNIVRIGSVFCDSCGTRLDKIEAPFTDIKNTSEMYFNTGMIFVEKRVIDKAKEYFQQAVSLEPLNNKYLFHLGEVLELSGEYDEAMECFKQIPEIDVRFEATEQHIQSIMIKKNIIDGLKTLGVR